MNKKLIDLDEMQQQSKVDFNSNSFTRTIAAEIHAMDKDKNLQELLLSKRICVEVQLRSQALITPMQSFFSLNFCDALSVATDPFLYSVFLKNLLIELW